VHLERCCAGEYKRPGLGNSPGNIYTAVAGTPPLLLLVTAGVYSCCSVLCTNAVHPLFGPQFMQAKGDSASAMETKSVLVLLVPRALPEELPPPL